MLASIAFGILELFLISLAVLAFRHPHHVAAMRLGRYFFPIAADVMFILGMSNNNLLIQNLLPLPLRLGLIVASGVAGAIMLLAFVIRSRQRWHDL